MVLSKLIVAVPFSTLTTYSSSPIFTLTVPVASLGNITTIVPLPLSTTLMLVSVFDTVNIVVLVEGKYFSSPLYLTLTKYSPLGRPDMINSPFPPPIATVYLESPDGTPNVPSSKLKLYSSSPIITVTFPVASAGTSNLIFSSSPTIMFTAVGITNDSTFSTVNVFETDIGLYLSSPAYVTFTLYVPPPKCGISATPVPLVTLT